MGGWYTREGAVRNQGGITREAALESHLQDEVGFERRGWGRVSLAKEPPEQKLGSWKEVDLHSGRE